MITDPIYEIGVELLDCVCGELALTTSGCPGRKCFVPGIDPEFANCCPDQGQATINVIRVVPSRDFPVPDLGSPGNCDAPWTVITYNVQVMRCAPVGNLNSSASCGALDSSAITVIDDMRAMRKGIRCCFKNGSMMEPLVGNVWKWVMGDHLSVGIEGGCAGSSLLVVVGYTTCWDC